MRLLPAGQYVARARVSAGARRRGCRDTAVRGHRACGRSVRRGRSGTGRLTAGFGGSAAGPSPPGPRSRSITCWRRPCSAPSWIAWRRGPTSPRPRSVRSSTACGPRRLKTSACPTRSPRRRPRSPASSTASRSWRARSWTRPRRPSALRSAPRRTSIPPWCISGHASPRAGRTRRPPGPGRPPSSSRATSRSCTCSSSTRWSGWGGTTWRSTRSSRAPALARRRRAHAAVHRGRAVRGPVQEGLAELDDLQPRPEDEAALALGLRVLYEAITASHPVESPEADRARMLRYAEAYHRLNGPSAALVDMWVAAATRDR